MDQYYVGNFRGKLYPHIHFEIRKNPSYGGAYAELISETRY